MNGITNIVPYRDWKRIRRDVDYLLANQGGGGWETTGTTTITGVTLVDMASNAVTVSHTTSGSQTNAFRPYKIYTALLNQSGTSAPTATVLENTLGGTVVWSYDSIGGYTATLSGAFTENKTVVNMMPTNYYDGGDVGQILFFRSGDNTCLMSTSINSVSVDDYLGNFPGFWVEIKVYY